MIWCDTNYEADALMDRMTDAVEVRGSDREADRSSKLRGFGNGEIKTLVTKPSVAGMGMNWQHCRHQVFAGLGFSFEMYDQAIRRCWRFGQTDPVRIDIVLSDVDGAMQSAIARKQSIDLMQSGMSAAMNRRREEGRNDVAVKYQPRCPIRVPDFLTRCNEAMA